MTQLNTIDDKFGGGWQTCDLEACGLHVVRPGKVQCNTCDVAALRAPHAMPQEALLAVVSHVQRTGERNLDFATNSLSASLVARQTEIVEAGRLPLVPATSGGLKGTNDYERKA